MSSRSRLCFRRWLAALVGLFAVLSVPSLQAQEGNAHHLPKRIVGDYVYWSKYQDPVYSAAQIPFHELTHINHAGISFAGDGTLSVPDGYIEPELNNRAHAAGVKVMVLMGGDFYGLETSGAIQTLVANAAAFAKQYHYDGFDIDWEYPETRADRRILVQLMDLLRKRESQLCPFHRRRPLGWLRIRSGPPCSLSFLFQYHDVRLRRSVDRLWPIQFPNLLELA